MSSVFTLAAGELLVLVLNSSNAALLTSAGNKYEFLEQRETM